VPVALMVAFVAAVIVPAKLLVPVVRKASQMALLSLLALYSCPLARALDKGREFRQKPLIFSFSPAQLISPTLSILPKFGQMRQKYRGGVLPPDCRP